MTNTGPPDTEFSVSKWKKHRLHAKVGLFNELVWECDHCGKVRREKTDYHKRCTESP